LARFDELVAKRPAIAPPPAAVRRVRPNAATAMAARLDAAVAARDIDGVARLLSGEMEAFHHPTGTPYDRTGTIASLRLVTGARDPRFQHEPLATLGDSLALCHSTSSFSALDDDAIGPFGAVERERIVLIEVDASGLQRRVELFDPARLANAIVRLYERHAELLPEGPERDLSAATARSVAAILGPYDVDRYATAISPSVE